MHLSLSQLKESGLCQALSVDVMVRVQNKHVSSFREASPASSSKPCMEILLLTEKEKVSLP